MQLDEADGDEVTSDDGSEEGVQDKQTNKNVYVPPKLAAVHYSKSLSVYCVFS